MPGPGVLFPTAAAFGCAAAFGVGIFIGLHWDTIKDRAQLFMEENRMLWEEVKVDFSQYNGPNSSDDEEEERRPAEKRPSWNSSDGSEIYNAESSASSRSDYNSSSSFRFPEPSQSPPLGQSTVASCDPVSSGGVRLRELTVYGESLSESDTEVESELNSELSDSFGEANLDGSEMSSFEEVEFSSAEMI